MALSQTAGVPRAQFYRGLTAPEPIAADTALREHVQRVALDYSCYGYRRVTKELLRQGIQVNHEKGNPYDNAKYENAKAESFMKTLKYEPVYLSEYENLANARTQIGHVLEAVYNQKRLHSSLGYLPPSEFEELTVKAETRTR